MTLKLPATIAIEKTDTKAVKLVLWSRENGFRETFSEFDSRSDASDFANKLAPFLLPSVLLTVEETTSFTYRIED